MNGPLETWNGAPDRRQHRRGFTVTPLRHDEAETDLVELGRTVAVALAFETAHPKAAVQRRLGIYEED